MERIFPIKSVLATGKRAIKEQEVQFLDMERGKDSITIGLDGQNTALTVDPRTAFEMALYILRHLSPVLYNEHVLDGETAWDRLATLTAAINRKL